MAMRKIVSLILALALLGWGAFLLIWGLYYSNSALPVFTTYGGAFLIVVSLYWLWADFGASIVRR